MDTTEKELEQQYNERHGNLKRSMHGIADSVEQAIHNTFEEIDKETEGLRSNQGGSDGNQMMTAAAPSSTQDTRWSHDDTEADSDVGGGFWTSRARKDPPSSTMSSESKTTKPSSSMRGFVDTSKRHFPEYIEHDLETENMAHDINQSAMDAVARDMDAMGHTDAEGFESVASKIEETFGSTALSDEGPDRSHYNKGSRHSLLDILVLILLVLTNPRCSLAWLHKVLAIGYGGVHMVVTFVLFYLQQPEGLQAHHTFCSTQSIDMDPISSACSYILSRCCLMVQVTLFMVYPDGW
ncbi:predicted protein [Lichtheimia corymbifera JMRC:FSU:9682]|uniref:Uncharacterized protein n=1 Tax=Lichtheimia corymbifera JMRC:FSU:9682 TaxID=1263082 RepID=A0A068SDV2_9FUNG|nr:predicted protein [Lichtheimia corymbifera JMRC:FSU:9682]